MFHVATIKTFESSIIFHRESVLYERKIKKMFTLYRQTNWSEHNMVGTTITTMVVL